MARVRKGKLKWTGNMKWDVPGKFFARTQQPTRYGTKRTRKAVKRRPK